MISPLRFYLREIDKDFICCQDYSFFTTSFTNFTLFFVSFFPNFLLFFWKIWNYFQEFSFPINWNALCLSEVLDSSANLFHLCFLFILFLLNGKFWFISLHGVIMIFFTLTVYNPDYFSNFILQFFTNWNHLFYR